MNSHAPTDHVTGRSLTLSVGVLASGIVTSAFGLLALSGWVLGLPLLANFGVDLIPMAPSTAVLFVLYGAAVCLRARLPLSRRAFRISVTAGYLGALVALLLFTLGCLHMQWPVENLGLNTTRTVRGAPIGHMSPVTAFCFLVASVSFLISLSLSATRAWRTALAFGSAGVLLGACFIFLLAYLYGAPLLYGGRFIPPALNTILAFAMLSLALLTLAGRPAWLFGGSPTEDSRIAFPLVLIFTLLAAVIIATSYIYYRHFEQHYRAEAEHQLSAIAELKVGELVQWRKERLQDTAICFKNPSFSALVRRFFEKPSDADAQRQLLDWLGKYPTAEDCDQVRLMDAQGVTRLSVPAGLKPASSDTVRAAAKVLQSGQVAIQDFHRHGDNQRVYLAVLMPILGEQETSPPLGVLVLRLDPTTYLYPFIQRWPTLSQSAETLLVRREGNEAVFLNELRFQTNTALSLRVSLEKTGFSAVRAVLGQKGIVEGLDYCGCPTIADVRAVPNSPWFLVARIDSAEVYAPLHERLWLTVLLAGLLLISAGALAGLLWRQQHVQVYKERAQAVEALKASETRFRSLFDSSRDAVMTLEPPSWKFTSGNPATVAMFGARNAEHFVTFGPWELSPEHQADGRASAEKAREMLETAMREGSHLFEWTHRRINGQEFPATVLLSRVEAAGKVFLQATARDITARKRSEESLRLQSAALEAAANAIVITDHNGIIQLVNPAFTALTGYTAQEAVGQNPRILKSGKQDKVFFRTLWQTISSGQVWSGELTNRRKDGSLYAEGMTITPLRNAEGRIAHYIAIKQDITERKRATEVLRESEEQFRAMFELASVGIAQADPHTAQWLLVNKKMCEITGYSAGELLQMRVPDITYPEDRQFGREAFERVVRGETPDYRMEKRYIRKDGALAWVNVNMTIIRDAAGQPIRTMAAIEDITKRKQAEKALRESDERFRQLADNITDAFWIRSSDMREVHYVSAAFERIWGRSVKSLYANPHQWADFILPEDRERVLGAFAALVGDARSLDIEYRILRPDGEIRWVRVRGFPVRDAADKLIRHIGIVTDITESKEAEEALRRTSELLLLTGELAKVGGWELDLRTMELFWSVETSRIHEVDPPVAPALDQAINFYAPEARPVLQAAVQAGIDSGAPFDLDLPMTTANGRPIWVRSQGSAVMENGKAVKLIGAFQDITERKRAELRFAAFANLGQRLNAADTARKATRIISEVADELLGWDACLFSLLSPSSDLLDNVLNVDTIDGRRVESSPGPEPRSALARRTIEAGGQLILKEKSDRMFPGSQPFGDSARPSASIMYVPARKGAEVVGVLSIQSYTSGAYDRQSLEALQELADHCGGALDRLRSEEALRRSEAKFRTLYDSTSDAVMLSTEKGFFDCNQATLAMFGYGTREEFCSKHPADLSPPVQPDGTDSLTLAKQRMATAMEKGSSQFEWMHKRADTGETFPAEVLLCALELDGKRVLQGSVRDITERKRSEESLRLQTAALEAAANGVVIADPKGTIQWVNPAFTHLTGYSAEEAIGQNPRVLKSGQHPESFYKEMWETISQGHTWKGEIINRRKDGQLYDEEMTITPVRDRAGAVSHFIAIKQDISQRKRAEEALREKEQRLSEAQRLGHIGSWFYDMTGPISWSEEMYHLYGVSPDTFTPTAESLLGLIYPDDRPAMQAWIAACAAGEKPGELEFRINLPDGTIRWIRGHGAAVHDVGNRLLHMAGTAHDITEHKVAETELAALHKQLLDASHKAGMAEIATNVLHNVGNVLNSVNISASLVVESAKQSKASSLARVVGLLQEHAHDLGEFITNDSRGKHVPAHLAQLAEHLLAEQETNARELASLQRNIEHIKEIVAMQQNYARFGGVKEMINVVSLVEDSLRLNEDALGRHRVEVIREFETVPLMNVERHKVVQILVNLLRNAKHACQDSERADKRLTVRVANGSDRIRISVIDNGVGIPPENLTRIFNHGFTTRRDGHGFGLHSGALAAKEMGGSLTVHSDGPGQGAAFTLELPLPDAEERA